MSIRGEWTFYDQASGACVGLFAGPAESLAQNTPAGCVALPGRHDPAATRLDLATRQVVPALPAVADPAAPARAERARLLAATDWRALRALETGAPMPAAWAAYRQALRNLPSQPGWPDDIAWPTSPSD